MQPHSIAAALLAAFCWYMHAAHTADLSSVSAHFRCGRGDRGLDSDSQGKCGNADSLLNVMLDTVWEVDRKQDHKCGQLQRTPSGHPPVYWDGISHAQFEIHDFQLEGVPKQAIAESDEEVFSIPWATVHPELDIIGSAEDPWAGAGSEPRVSMTRFWEIANEALNSTGYLVYNPRTIFSKKDYQWWVRQTFASSMLMDKRDASMNNETTRETVERMAGLFAGQQSGLSAPPQGDSHETGQDVNYHVSETIGVSPFDAMNAARLRDGTGKPIVPLSIPLGPNGVHIDGHNGFPDERETLLGFWTPVHSNKVLFLIDKGNARLLIEEGAPRLNAAQRIANTQALREGRTDYVHSLSDEPGRAPMSLNGERRSHRDVITKGVLTPPGKAVLWFSSGREFCYHAGLALPAEYVSLVRSGSEGWQEAVLEGIDDMPSDVESTTMRFHLVPEYLFVEKERQPIGEL